MKKSLLITIGIVLILIIGGAWAYFFVLGVPQDGEGIFSNFGFGNDTAPVVSDPNPSIVDTSPIDQSGDTQRLRQLTSRPVAGAAFITGGIRYAEKGTGHTYDIMFSNGNETLIASLTTPRVVEAVFSPEATRVALISENGNVLETYVGTFTKNDAGEGSIDGINLPTNVREIGFSDTGEEVYYLEETVSGTAGRAYNVLRQTSRTLFTIPFKDVRVLWGDTSYVYTSPSIHQSGYLYKVTGSTLELIETGRGLTAFAYENGFVVAREKNELFNATAYESSGSTILPYRALPEKCTGDNGATSSVFCAEPLIVPEGEYPDDWYKGVVSFSDTIWHSDVALGSDEFLVDLLAESGRSIDVVAIGNSLDGNYLYFINKNDDTLWMYDLTL